MARLHVWFLAACLNNPIEWTRVQKLRSSAFIWYACHPQTFFFEGAPTWSVGLLFVAVPSTFCHPPDGTMVAEATYWGNVPPLPKNEGVLESPRPPTLVPWSPVQLWLASPTSKLRRKWEIRSHYNDNYTPPVHRPFPQCICVRVKACTKTLWWPTGTTPVVSVGHGNGMVLAQPLLPSSRPKTLLKITYGPIRCSGMPPMHAGKSPLQLTLKR